MTNPYGYQWQKLTKYMRANSEPVCGICGRWIDTTLPQVHRESWTLDHLDPIKWHGTQVPDVTRVQPAHKHCNSRRNADERTVSPRSEQW